VNYGRVPVKKRRFEMKKIVLLFVVVLTMLALTACGVQGAAGTTLTQLPDEGVNLIFVLVTAALGWLLAKVPFLGSYKEAIAAIAAPIIITFVESWLGTIDPIFDNLVLTLIHALVLFVAALGTIIATKRVSAKETKALME
jgi:hypothetical protein